MNQQRVKPFFVRTVVRPENIGNARVVKKTIRFKTEKPQRILNKQNNNEIAFLALNKLLSDKNSVFQTLFWILAILTCCTVCIWHMTTSLQRYFEGPTSATLTIEEITEFKFPHIVICPTSSSSYYSFATPFMKRCNANPKCRQMNSFREKSDRGMAVMNISLKDLWFDQKVIVKTLNNIGKMFNLDTHLGNCVVVNSENLFNFEDWNGLIGVQQMNTFTGTLIDAVFAYAGSDGVNKFNLKPRSLLREAFVVETVSLHEYHLLKNCASKEEVLKCYEEQANDILHNDIINCSLPYIQSKELKFCPSVSEAERTQFVIYKYPKCNLRACERVSYQVEQARDFPHFKPKNASYLLVSLHSQSKDVVKEYYVYPLSQLLADLATSIGIFLGISLLSVFEFIYALLLRFFKLLAC